MVQKKVQTVFSDYKIRLFNETDDYKNYAMIMYLIF